MGVLLGSTGIGGLIGGIVGFLEVFLTRI